MSIKVMSYVWEHSQQRGAKLLVMLALADFADDNGYSFPKMKTIAEKARVTEGTAKDAIFECEQTGEIVVWERYIEGVQRSNVYQIALPGVSPEPPDIVKGTLALREMDRRTAKSDGAGVKNIPLGDGNSLPQGDGIQVPNDPSLDPSLDPERFSPGGEPPSDVPNSSSKPDPEAPKTSRPRNVMFDAVSWAWNNQNGGYIAKLVKFLEGRCQPADGLYYRWQLAPPLTPVEVVAFRLWRDHVERDMPKIPETLQRTIEEFRGVPEYGRVMARAERRLAELELALENPPHAEPDGSPGDSVAQVVESSGIPDEDAIPGDVDAVFAAMAQQLGGKYDTGLG